MGYRTYLGRISKNTLNEIKHIKTEKELYQWKYPDEEFPDEEDLYVGVYDIVDQSLHEIGKYIYFTDELKEKYGTNVFLDSEFNDYVNDEHDLFIVDKRAVEYIIEKYNEDMCVYYDELKAMSLVINLYNEDTIPPQYQDDWNSAIELLKRSKDIYIMMYACNISSETISYFGQKIQNHFRSEWREYSNDIITFYDLDLSKPNMITNSWKKDKEILQLVHILKTFDFENNHLVIYSY